MVAQSPRYGLVQIAIILLTAATAAIHLYLALVLMPALTGGVDIVFLLNGLGYLGLLAALYLPLGFLAPWKSLIRWVLLGYTALTILLWVIMAGERTALGYVDKLIEVALVVLLYLESQQRSRA